eukprot:CAMPEP_0197620386 /NCGR_PEP_ID=MMETSP1338-20131121/1224_1 /TAXON_ID=43686 ORGANISM="Pelagodinium beii, Strain RCC1491" /NCGR_SAMPLE_ID=MMETSP1338 /ASSEMBLY_ACC=CAM_ASM_000754 /LENGTH=142 /DNA_ID=CAMNT_0043189561 /DNA_START=65 /DNA_END=493 /DNA_ORIENTATION=+
MVSARALVLLVAVALAANLDEVEVALSSDSECTDSNNCAFNALQVHGGKADAADLLKASFLALSKVQTGDCRSASVAAFNTCKVFEKNEEDPNYQPTEEDLQEVCKGACGKTIQKGLTSCPEGSVIDGQDMNLAFKQLTSVC